MVKKIAKNHYLAAPAKHTSSQRSLVSHSYMGNGTSRTNRAYSTDEDRSGSERTVSEYINGSLISGSRSGRQDRSKSSRSDRARSYDRSYERSKSGDKSRYERHARSLERSRGPSRHSYTDHEGSDIYITSPAYRAPSEYSRGSRLSRHTTGSHHTNASHHTNGSHYSYRSAAPSVISGATTIKTRLDKKRGVLIETMSAPNPFCPNIKGMCCLMLLLNLGLILVALGFVIVIQIFEPLYVWILGIVFLVFGFLTLVGSLIYCVTVCRDFKSPSQVAATDHYWTRHWQKNIGAPPEIHYTTSEEKYHNDPDSAYNVSEKHHRPRY